MKQFGVILFGLSLALLMSCSKEEEVKVVYNSEPVIPQISQELTGEFEGRWTCGNIYYSKGKVMVDDGYIVIDELPTETLLNSMIWFIQDSSPEMKAEIVDSIGNIFFASSYKYPITDLQIKYEMGDYSAIDGVYNVLLSNIKNIWSTTTTVLKDTTIGPPEPNTISFSVWADDVLYRIDLISKSHVVNAVFHMKPPQWENLPAGLWIIQYWFSTYRVINLQTGQQVDLNVGSFEGLDRRLRQGKEETLQLLFNATQRTGDSYGNTVHY